MATIILQIQYLKYIYFLFNLYQLRIWSYCDNNPLIYGHLLNMFIDNNKREEISLYFTQMQDYLLCLSPLCHMYYFDVRQDIKCFHPDQIAALTVQPAELKMSQKLGELQCLHCTPVKEAWHVIAKIGKIFILRFSLEIQSLVFS